MKRPFTTQKRVIAAINFDQHTKSIIDAGVSICRQTGHHLHIVNVCEPWLQNYLLPYETALPLWELNDQIADSLVEDAEKKLEKIKREIPSDITFSTKTLVGTKNSWLKTESEQNTALVIVGAERKLSKSFFKGSTTALEVISQSEAPVLIISEGQTLDFGKESFKILISDDLNPKTEQALDFACDVATKLKSSKILHAHIANLDVDTLDAALTAASATVHKTRDSFPSSEKIHQSIMALIESKMEQKKKDWSEALESSHCEYHSQITVASGEVSDELQKISNDFQPDLEVYGVHRSGWKHPFSPGEMPINAMFSHNCPIVVIS